MNAHPGAADADTEMRLSGKPSVRTAFELLLLAGLAVHALHTGLGVGGDRIDSLVTSWLYVGLLVACAGGCVARAISVAQERGAWLWLGVGLTCSAAGDAYFTLVLGGSDSNAGSTSASPACS